MPTLDVKKSWQTTLRVNYSAGRLRFRMEYDSGYNFPWAGIYLSQPEWDRLVAWVELQRKEEALEEGE